MSGFVNSGQLCLGFFRAFVNGLSIRNMGRELSAPGLRVPLAPGFLSPAAVMAQRPTQFVVIFAP